jgi:HlyD family secretion protein
MNRKPFLFIAAIAAAIAAAAFWWQFAGKDRNGSPAKLTLYGNVDIRQVELSFRVGGRIAAIQHDEGDAVSAGTLLASLDTEPLYQERELAAAELRLQQAQLARLLAGYRPEEIAQARSRVEELRVRHANAGRFHDRARTLYEASAVSRQALDDARTLMDEAEARLQAARDALALLEAGFRAEDIAAARAAAAAAEARLTLADICLADGQLHAPTAGVLLARVREPGAMVAAGATVFTLALTEPVWVRAYIDEPDLGRIHPGLPVSIETDTPGRGPYRGIVGYISPQAEFTPKHVQTRELRTSLVYRLRIVVSDPDEGLRQGMPVTIHLAAAPPAPVRPPAAP